MEQVLRGGWHRQKKAAILQSQLQDDLGRETLISHAEGNLV